MRTLKYFFLLICVIFSLTFLTLSAGPKAAKPAKAKKKVESTDPALRLKWHKQHMAMKTATP